MTTTSTKDEILNRALFIAENAGFNDDVGICLACGHEQGGCEPDARRYKCEVCGAEKVYGVDEILIMWG